jgi:hypothetical protein
MRQRSNPVLLAKLDNPLNRMVREDRKRKKFGKATGVLSVALGGILLAIALTSRTALISLESLSDQRIAGSTFVLLDFVGVACAIFTGFLLLRYKHFSRVSFSATCGLAIFFGLTLPLMQVAHSQGELLSLVGIEGILALVVSGVVMGLSILSG